MGLKKGEQGGTPVPDEVEPKERQHNAEEVERRLVHAVRDETSPGSEDNGNESKPEEIAGDVADGEGSETDAAAR